MDYTHKNALSRSEVRAAFAMALRSKQLTEDKLTTIIDKTFQKADENRGFHSDFITFEEYHAVLRN